MSTIRVGTVAALLAGLALSASPVVAQDRREGGERGRGQAQGGRRNPNAGNQGSGESGGSGARSRGRGREEGSSQADGSGQAQADRGDRGNRDGANNNAEARREAPPRPEARERDRNDARRADRNDTNRDWDRDRDRDRDRGRPIIIEPRNRDNRYAPRYAPRYNSRPNRVYVVPYGYRPQGYRPGWNVNLYFGRPYAYANRGYGYGYGYDPRSYGYYAIPQGFAYGSLRIVDAPRDAQVFVDGYYAGIVDDYDGVFQHLNLEPGVHRIEIDVYPGAPPLEFEVNVAPGQTVTYRARY